MSYGLLCNNGSCKATSLAEKCYHSKYYFVEGCQAFRLELALLLKLHLTMCDKEYQRYTNVDLKISVYVCIHRKAIPRKFRILNPN